MKHLIDPNPHVRKSASRKCLKPCQSILHHPLQPFRACHPRTYFGSSLHPRLTLVPPSVPGVFRPGFAGLRMDAAAHVSANGGGKKPSSNSTVTPSRRLLDNLARRQSGKCERAVLDQDQAHDWNRKIALEISSAGHVHPAPKQLSRPCFSSLLVPSDDRTQRTLGRRQKELARRTLSSSRTNYAHSCSVGPLESHV
ncbi:hypothetical protein BDW22DRAFT_1358104 [Trametopsis cervina]|nr:hypothetical protein BDW22DRAFT_1358104 [Trametopsis cervina]